MSMDPEVLAGVLAIIAPDGVEDPAPVVGDVTTRREKVGELLVTMGARQRKVDDLEVVEHAFRPDDGAMIAIREYRVRGKRQDSAVYYIHGGGMILGSVEAFDPIIRTYVHDTGVPFFAVDYRLAPEFPHPTPVEDSYAGLVWLADHAGDFGVDPSRITVMGESAGGGLAAAVALLARDRSGPALRSQVLIYPMLDDRNVVASADSEERLTWSYDDNVTGWGALLGDAAGGGDVSPYAAPARAESLAGLPPTYLEVGQLDIFRDEVLTFAARLAGAGVATELHLHPGAPHAFELFAPLAQVSVRSRADRIRVIQAV